MIKKIFIFLLFALIVIQFIRPKKNKAKGPQPNYIDNNFLTSADVKSILAKACNDCHSNNTVYPWYAQVQPVTWWLNDHIKEGKKELDFSQFANYSIRRQYKKLEEINEQVKKNEMPLNSYLWVHKDATLDNEQKLLLANWVTTLRDSIKANYPPDSLTRKK